MRKANREVQDKQELKSILEKCDVCRIAFMDNDFPYIVPMSFGFEFEEKLVLFFHCAMEGRKLEIMKQNNNVCFEMDCSHELKVGEAACNYSMNYESIIGTGKIELVQNEQYKILALNQIMQHYGRTDNLEYNKEVLERTAILKIVAEHFAGKKLNK